MIISNKNFVCSFTNEDFLNELNGKRKRELDTVGKQQSTDFVKKVKNFYKGYIEKCYSIQNINDLLEYVNVILDSNNTGSNGVNKWGVADENGIVAGESFAPENPTCTIL